MFGYRKKYNDLIYKIIRLKDTKEIYTEHLKVIYKGTDGNDKIKLGAQIKANSDSIEALNEILKHREKKIGIFGYRKKYEELWRNIFFLKVEIRVQRDQYEWKIGFDNSTNEDHYSMEERSRLEGLYERAADLVIELNNILGIEI